MKKNYKRYGGYFVLAWNALLLLLSLVDYLFFNKEIYRQLFYGVSDAAFSAAFLIVGVVVFFLLGYCSRKTYVTKLVQYRSLNPLLDPSVADRRFRCQYISGYTGFLYKLVIPMIPIYALIRRNFSDFDFVVLSLLLVLSIFFFYIHKKAKQKGKEA